MEKMKPRQANAYDAAAASAASALLCETATLTVQYEEDATNINLLVRRFSIDDFAAMTAERQEKAYYGDIEGLQAGDYAQMLNSVLEAKERFNELPAKVRSRFENDPAQLLAFLDDPRNEQEAIELGLVNPRPSTDETPSPASRGSDSDPPDQEPSKKPRSKHDRRESSAEA